MPGALSSAMDIVIQLSSDLIERTVRSRFASVRQSCFETTISVPGYGRVNLRKLTLTVDRVRLTQLRDVDGINTVSVSIDIRLFYGEAQIAGSWVSLESLEPLLGFDPRVRTESFVLRCIPSGESDVVLSVELGDTANDLPEELREALDVRIRLPLDFLHQRLGDADDPDAPSVLRGVIDPPVQAKVMADGTLALGLGVTLSQDELPGDDDEDSDARGGTPGHCGLPDQPTVWDDEFAVFQDDFSETFLAGADWGIALDKHILDAILRGLPSAELNRDREDPERECANKGSIRFSCLTLDELRDDELIVRGRAQVFVCPNNPAPDGWWQVCFSATATLELVPGQGLVGRYRMHRDVEVCGSDSGWTFWIDVISVFDDIDLWDYVPEEVRQGTFSPPFPDAIGNREDPTGRLRVSGVRLRADGVVVTGTADVALPEARVLRAPERVLFGAACDDEANTRDVTLAGAGRRLKVCPLNITDLPSDDPAYVQGAAARFSIVRPGRLMEGGNGVSLDPGETVDVRLSLDGDAGGQYGARLAVPNNAAETNIRLVADLRETRVVSEIPRQLLLHGIQYARPCNQGFPRAVPLREQFEITHEGPGFLQVCRAAFSDFEEGQLELDDEGEPIVDDDGEAVYRWSALEAEPLLQDGTPVFHAGCPPVTEPGTFPFSVVFAPGETHAGRRYRARLRIVTNASNDDGDFVLTVTGHLERRADQFGIFEGGFETDVFCGDADWDRAQDTGGRLLEPAAFQLLFDILGGLGCCPPPRGPACRCLDLLEFSFSGLPGGAEPVLLSDGETVAQSRPSTGSHTLIAPVAERREYTLIVGGLRPIQKGGSSTVEVRRWILQQDGFYPSGARLNAVAVVGTDAFATRASGLDVVDLSNRSRPTLAGQWTLPDEDAQTIRALGLALLVANGELGVYSMEHRQPHRIAGVELPAALTFFLADDRLGPLPSAVWGWGDGLTGIKVSSGKPTVVAHVPTRVQATAGFIRGGRAFLFGRAGVELFDLSHPHRPVTVSFLPSSRPIVNAFPTADGALVVMDGAVGRISLDDPAAFQLIDEWQIEEVFRPYVPLHGGLIPYGPGFLALEPNGLGFRLMRVRANRIDLEKLDAHRGSQTRAC